MKELYQKLVLLKNEIGSISKDKENPFFKSKYFDINSLLFHVEPLLQRHGLLLLQPIRSGLVVSLIIDPESGQEISSDIELPSIADPQKLGSAITYYRRYTLQSLLGLQAEDDDGNVASKANPKVKG
ncbi:MAG: ERF family protein, partial [Candidatus Neomarinimicrobiota bacterium]